MSLDCSEKEESVFTGCIIIGHMDCVDILLKKGADVSCIDGLFIWCCRGSLCNRAGLTRAPTTWNPYIQGDSALIQAARSKQYKCVEFLIESGANVNITDPRAMLSLAARAGNVTHRRKTVEILVKAGADVNATYSDKTGATTPLAEVVKRCTPMILNILIEAGADVNFGRECNFPLFPAVCHGKVESLKLLIQKGADVNKRNCAGNTTLHRNLISHCFKIFHVLMKSGADVNVVNNAGMTSLIVAVQFYPDTHYYSEAVKSRCVKNICRLLKAGAQIGRRDHLGRNSLQLSIKKVRQKSKIFRSYCMLQEKH